VFFFLLRLFVVFSLSMRRSSTVYFLSLGYQIKAMKPFILDKRIMPFCQVEIMKQKEK